MAEQQEKPGRAFVVRVELFVARAVPPNFLQDRLIADQNGLQIYGVASSDEIASTEAVSAFMAGYHEDYGCICIAPIERVQVAEGERKRMALEALERPHNRNTGWAVLVPNTLGMSLPSMVEKTSSTGRTQMVTDTTFTVGIESSVEESEQWLLMCVIFDLYIRLGWLWRNETFN